MPKIVVFNQMFDRYNKTKIFFDDGTVVEYPNGSPKYVLGLCEQYGIGTVYLKGNKLFNQKYIKNFNQEQIVQYSQLKYGIENI